MNQKTHEKERERKRSIYFTRANKGVRQSMNILTEPRLLETPK